MGLGRALDHASAFLLYQTPWATYRPVPLELALCLLIDGRFAAKGAEVRARGSVLSVADLGDRVERSEADIGDPLRPCAGRANECSIGRTDRARSGGNSITLLSFNSKLGRIMSGP